jgi:methionyl aminopeptidase
MGLIKSFADVRCLKEAGRIVRELLEILGAEAKPGVSTVALEVTANRFLAQHRSSAPFKTFERFNQAICVSLNEEIVNGPPNRERLICEGDVVSIATAAEHRGIYAKAARTFYIGSEPSDDIQRLLTGTATVIAQAIQQSSVHSSSPVTTLNDLLRVVPETASQFGLTVIRDLGGAGIGKKLHDAPPIPNDPAALQETIPLRPGLCFTLMPMLSLGNNPDCELHEDGWTLVTNDRSTAAHVADTLLMSGEGLINITGA